MINDEHAIDKLNKRGSIAHDFYASVSAVALFIVYCYVVVASFYMELKELKKKKHHSDNLESTPLIDHA